MEDSKKTANSDSYTGETDDMILDEDSVLAELDDLI